MNSNCTSLEDWTGLRKVENPDGFFIAVDFDGTCVTHDYPQIGQDIGAQDVLKRIVECDCNLILWTMRSGPELNEAVEWFERNGIPLSGIQVNPNQRRWTNSPKAYAHMYIDDAALGAPLKLDPSMSHRPFIDWEKVSEMLWPSQKLLGQEVEADIEP